MSDFSSLTTVIVVADEPGIADRWRPLFHALTDANIVITVVQEPAEATAQIVMSAEVEVHCVLIEAGDLSSAGKLERVLARVRAIAAVPDVEPVVVAHRPPSHLVIRAMRGGAGDFIDLADEPDQDAVAVLSRVASRYVEKSRLREHVRALRIALDDFLKNLVQTERRSIDLERQLALQRQGGEATGVAAVPAGAVDPIREVDPERPPTVLVVEDDRDVADLLVDRLERVGLITYAFVSGEEAVTQAVAMAHRGEAIDLALVDNRLPGMDGLEAIRQMREAKPNLAAMLMTGYSDDTATAISAADLGVVGYVLKPFDDIPKLIERIERRAIKSRNSAREHHYLDQIKQRHEKILLRYRKLARQLAMD